MLRMETLSHRENLCKAAREFIEHGLAIYPVNAVKKPLFKKWNDAAAFRDADRAETFLAKYENAQGIGIALGPSNLLVLDVDPKNGGDVTFRRLVFEVGFDIFEGCPQVISPSGSFHAWFWQPANKIASRTHGLGQGVDIVGCRNGVVAPPSRRADGPYVWRFGEFPNLSAMPVFPEILIERMATERKRTNTIGKTTRTFGERLPDAIPVSERNAYLSRTAYKLRQRFGFTEEELKIALRELNRRCNVPLEENELQDMARSIVNRPAATVDPSAWLTACIPHLRTKQEYQVATTLAMIAEFAIGPLTPSKELFTARSGGMHPTNYYKVRGVLEKRGLLHVHHRENIAPVIELRMPAA